MGNITPTGPQGPSSSPIQPQPSNGASNAPAMNSPFAQMFAKTGMTPTPKELKMIIDNLLRDQISEIKKNDQRWKEAMRKWKEELEETS